MKSQNENLKSMLENLTEEEKLQMFSIEELETRLEMSGGITPTQPAPANTSCDGACTW